MKIYIPAAFFFLSCQLTMESSADKTIDSSESLDKPKLAIETRPENLPSKNKIIDWDKLSLKTKLQVVDSVVNNAKIESKIKKKMPNPKVSAFFNRPREDLVDLIDTLPSQDREVYLKPASLSSAEKETIQNWIVEGEENKEVIETSKSKNGDNFKNTYFFYKKKIHKRIEEAKKAGKDASKWLELLNKRVKGGNAVAGISNLGTGSYIFGIANVYVAGASMGLATIAGLYQYYWEKVRETEVDQYTEIKVTCNKIARIDTDSFDKLEGELNSLSAKELNEMSNQGQILLASTRVGDFNLCWE